jgi:hypothetical protein
MRRIGLPGGRRVPLHPDPDDPVAVLALCDALGPGGDLGREDSQAGHELAAGLGEAVRQQDGQPWMSSLSKALTTATAVRLDSADISSPSSCRRFGAGHITACGG